MGAIVGSVDRKVEWEKACMKALGYEPVPEEHLPHSDEPIPACKIVSLLPETPTEKPLAPKEPWYEALSSIEQSMNQMIDWINEKMMDYTSVYMPDKEAFLIQSTVTSYTATTAREIEALRGLAQGESQREQHQQSMVQILMERLKEIAIVFARLQKQRNRMAVQLWNNPLQCRLVTSPPDVQNRSRDSMDEVLGLDDQDDFYSSQQFRPTRPAHSLQQHFLETYERDATISIPPRPVTSLFRKRQPQESPTAVTADKKRSRTESPPSKMPYQVIETPDYLQEEQLQQEAVLLKASVNGELDEVQKMEQMMVDITRLLVQFSDLVAEQQEEVIQIYEATTTSKSNVEKGQEHLAEATQRTKASRHYMATTITAMSIVLLVFHWMHP